MRSPITITRNSCEVGGPFKPGRTVCPYWMKVLGNNNQLNTYKKVNQYNFSSLGIWSKSCDIKRESLSPMTMQYCDHIQWSQHALCPHEYAQTRTKQLTICVHSLFNQLGTLFDNHPSRVDQYAILICQLLRCNPVGLDSITFPSHEVHYACYSLHSLQSQVFVQLWTMLNHYHE